jgi:hypothetical protein
MVVLHKTSLEITIRAEQIPLSLIKTVPILDEIP